MPADFPLDNTIDDTCVSRRHFRRALDPRRAANLVALVGDSLRPPNGQQCMGKASGPGASRNTN